jgi:hypothetical protein
MSPNKRKRRPVGAGASSVSSPAARRNSTTEDRLGETLGFRDVGELVAFLLEHEHAGPTPLHHVGVFAHADNSGRIGLYWPRGDA